MVRPRALAVDWLITNSNGGLQNGKISRLGAPEDFTGIDADSAPTVGDIGSVAHQPAPPL
jgi:hypothetical protein